MGKTNDRCPLQAECEKKCEYIRRELDCPYYHVNARPGYEIDDQEDRRRAEWKKAEEAEYHLRLPARQHRPGGVGRMRILQNVRILSKFDCSLWRKPL